MPTFVVTVTTDNPGDSTYRLNSLRVQLDANPGKEKKMKVFKTIFVSQFSSSAIRCQPADAAIQRKLKGKSEKVSILFECN